MNELNEIFWNYREKYRVSNHEFQRRAQISTLLNTEDFVFKILEPDSLDSFKITAKRGGVAYEKEAEAIFLVALDKLDKRVEVLEVGAYAEHIEALINRIRTVLNI